MTSSTDSNRLAMLAAGSLLAVIVSVAGAGLAIASPEDCDAGLNTRPDLYQVVRGGGRTPSANERRISASPSWFGSSFNAYGRIVELHNGSGFNFSYALITAGFQMGDQVWIDRCLALCRVSHFIVPSARLKNRDEPSKMDNYPDTGGSTQQVINNGGWKQCGPFNNIRTAAQAQRPQLRAGAGIFSDLVMNWNTSTRNHFATRACMLPRGSQQSVCGAWYIDRS